MTEGIDNGARDPRWQERVAQVLKDPTRREIVRMVRTGVGLKLGLGDVAMGVDISRAAAHYHLLVLADTGVLVTRPAPGSRSREALYVIDPRISALPGVDLVLDAAPTLRGSS